MASHFKKNDKVEWNYLGRAVLGSVEEIFLKSVTKTIKGKKITRHGSEEKPAYLAKSEAGNIALKLETEIKKQSKLAKPAKQKAPSPRMFGGGK